MIPSNELAFAAGIIEGEGSVRINCPTRRNKGALIVAMTNTNKELVDWMNYRWPGYCKEVSGLRADQKKAWCWTIASAQALRFLGQIKKHVVSQRLRERIRTGEWWQKIKAKPWQKRTTADDEEAFSCWLYMAHLNKRGTGIPFAK